MTYLIIGTLNDKALSFISLSAKKITDIFICLDEKNLDKNILDSYKNVIYINESITINTIEGILKEYRVDKVINFYELNSLGHSLDIYNKYNYEFVMDLYNIVFEYDVQHLTHVSTPLLYKETLANLRIEEERSVVTSDYTQSKLNAELYLLKQPDVAVVRVCDVYGINYENNYFNNIINNIIDNKEVYLPKDYNYVRGYLNHTDFATILRKVSVCKLNGLYNISSDFFISLYDIYSVIKDKLNYKKDEIYIEHDDIKYKGIRMDGMLVQDKVSFKLDKEKEKFLFFLEECSNSIK